MVMQFIGNLLGVKANQAVNVGIEALVRWDPEGATEAELRTMEQHLDELGLQVARARQSYDRERKEADAIQALAHQRLAAAEALQNQVNAEIDPTHKVALEKSLTTLIDLTEKMAPDVQREAQDAEDAKAFLQQLEAAYADAGGKLKRARSQLEKAQRDMARAAQRREMAEQQAEAARRAAGLSQTTSSLNIALRAMNENAARDLASAEAAAAKARLLSPTRPEKEDANIAAAMAAVSGQESAPVGIANRLAALKAKLA
jgi:DNA repair exonuclease SbcCD ATPase subunit